MEFRKDPYQNLFFSYYTLLTFKAFKTYSYSSISMPMILTFYKDIQLQSLVKLIKITEPIAANNLNVNVDKYIATSFHPRQKIFNANDSMIKINKSIMALWLECRFLDTEIDVRIRTSVCCILEQDTLSALPQLTQL